ncbi:MAG TPA: hypothetical protein VGJ38_11055, partial [Jatrophihabitantaceae bacterium]
FALAVTPADAVADQLRVRVVGPRLFVGSTTADVAAHDVTLAADADTVTITDNAPGASLTAEASCVVTAPATVSCPRAGIDVAQVSTGAADDVIDARQLPFRTELWGVDGDDRLTGGGGGDELHGGAGADTLDGGPGDDVLETADREVDAAITCGAGDDRLDDDLDDPLSDCEVIAPEWDVEPALSAGPYVVGATLTAGDYAVVAEGPTAVSITWLSCTGGFTWCVAVSEADEYVIAPEDAGHRIFARVAATNRAGSIQAETALTPVVPGSPPEASAPAPVPVPSRVTPTLRPPRTPRPQPAGTPVARPRPTPSTRAERMAQRRAAVAALLAPIAADVARLNLARLRPRVRHRVTFPFYGNLTVRWYVSAATGRRYGVRLGKGVARVLVAEGRQLAGAGANATIVVRPTARGRAILRRARRLALTVTAGLEDAGASASVTLRRR